MRTVQHLRCSSRRRRSACSRGWPRGVRVRCALPPKALVDARDEFSARPRRASRCSSIPTDVHEADLALQKAEAAWNDDPDDPNTIDLAVIAQRKAQIAEAEAAAIEGAAGRRAGQARAAGDRWRRSSRPTRGQLDQTQQALGQTQMQLQQQQAQAAAQKKQLADLEAKLKDARDTIAKIAAVKDDDRGMVITLQGEVLFKTGKWDLKPGAMAKLDQIADALRGKEQPIVVFGFTDNVGTVRHEHGPLAEARAVGARLPGEQGHPAGPHHGAGQGPGQPRRATTARSRAAPQNRRVEIVVSPKKS